MFVFSRWIPFFSLSFSPHEPWASLLIPSLEQFPFPSARCPGAFSRARVVPHPFVSPSAALSFSQPLLTAACWHSLLPTPFFHLWAAPVAQQGREIAFQPRAPSGTGQTLPELSPAAPHSACSLAMGKDFNT